MIPTTMNWRRARVRIFDRDQRLRATHRRVRLTIENGTARVLGSDGLPLAEATIADGEKRTARSLNFTTADGERWVAEQAGCGCGGG